MVCEKCRFLLTHPVLAVVYTVHVSVIVIIIFVTATHRRGHVVGMFEIRHKSIN